MDTEATANKLYEALTSISTKVLSDNQKEKLHSACIKVILDNPKLDFDQWKIAGKIYMNFIIDFPDMHLGGTNNQSDLIEP